jgi:hypothetical protein
MHGSSHIPSCVLQYHAALAEGCGRHVLEDMEHMFSEVKPVVKTFKYMAQGRYLEAYDALLCQIEERKVGCYWCASCCFGRVISWDQTASNSVLGMYSMQGQCSSAFGCTAEYAAGLPCAAACQPPPVWLWACTTCKGSAAQRLGALRLGALLSMLLMSCAADLHAGGRIHGRAGGR